MSALIVVWRLTSDEAESIMELVERNECQRFEELKPTLCIVIAFIFRSES